MVEASIPVDLPNPGQVFASLGFLEAADVLCGDAEGGFDWSDEADVRFKLRAAGDENPFAVVLSFLAEAEIQRCAPTGYADPISKKAPVKDDNGQAGATLLVLSETFPRPKAERMALPILLVSGSGSEVGLEHWTDGSSRNDFKLYAGNRSADQIASAMAKGTRGARGISALWSEQRDTMLERPFDVLTPIGGSFNFDPRGGWTAINAGYSPNEHKHRVQASPALELLAVWGLEHARPDEYETRQVRYGAWKGKLPPLLARAALGGVSVGIPMRRFRFALALSGKEKVVTFAQEEKTS